MSKRKRKRKKSRAQSQAAGKSNNRRTRNSEMIKLVRRHMQIVAGLLGVASVIGFAIFGAIYGHNKVEAIWYLFCPSAIIAIIAGCLQWHLLVSERLNPQGALEETVTSGFLVPGDEPTPPNRCTNGPFPLPKDAMLVILGNSASWGTSFPQTVIKIGNDRMLTMDEIAGQIKLSGKFFSSDGRIVAELKDNEFFINPNNYFRKKRPDSHSLVVYDQQGVEVLNARFINSHTMKITGVIRHPLTTVEISETRGIFRNTICTGEAGDAHFAWAQPSEK